MDELDDPAAIRLDAFITMATGATAYMNPRWRSLLDGPLFGAFGWYADDGSRTAKSDEIKRLAAWAAQPEVAPLWKMKPMPGDVAIVLVDEAQDWCYAMQGDTNAYAGCVRGLHLGLTAAGISCDFIKADAAMLRDHRVAYVPFPVALSDQTMPTLMQWAEVGGHLILESCAGYFDDQAHAFPTQPSRQIGKHFGPIVARSSFALDQHDGLKIKTAMGDLPCALYRQTYTVGDGIEALGHYEDGSAAIVQRKAGSGAVTLLGSNPSFAMQKQQPASALAWLRSLLPTSQPNRPPLPFPEAIIRQFQDETSIAQWIINPTHEDINVTLRLPSPPTLLRGDLVHVTAATPGTQVRIPAQDAAVLRWQK